MSGSIIICLWQRRSAAAWTYRFIYVNALFRSSYTYTLHLSRVFEMPKWHVCSEFAYFSRVRKYLSLATVCAQKIYMLALWNVTRELTSQPLTCHGGNTYPLSIGYCSAWHTRDNSCLHSANTFEIAALINTTVQTASSSSSSTTTALTTVLYSSTCSRRLSRFLSCILFVPTVLVSGI